MKKRCAITMGALGALFIASVSVAQVDAFWMRSWTEAQKSRPATMSSTGRIAPAEELGVPLIVRGQVFQPDGRTPAGDIVVHSYHRDAKGFDFGPGDNTMTTWRLQGWIKTDKEGRFEFRTIRPAPDNLGREGSHVHFTFESPNLGKQWAPVLFFVGDPLLSEAKRRESAKEGEFGWIREIETVAGVQQVSVKFRLKNKADF
jgi:protocatechuate 3,4-dioxygenase beta subunit